MRNSAPSFGSGVVHEESRQHVVRSPRQATSAFGRADVKNVSGAVQLPDDVLVSSLRHLPILMLYLLENKCELVVDLVLRDM